MSQEKEIVPGVQHDEESPQDLTKTMTVDTIHGDEAMKVLARYSGDKEWTEEEEKRLRRKIDWKLMTILCITYGLQYYDKAMLSQAVSGPQAFIFTHRFQSTDRHPGAIRPTG